MPSTGEYTFLTYFVFGFGGWWFLLFVLFLSPSIQGEGKVPEGRDYCQFGPQMFPQHLGDYRDRGWVPQIKNQQEMDSFVSRPSRRQYGKACRLYTERFQTSALRATKANDERGQLHLHSFYLFELSHKIAFRERFPLL